MKLKFSLLNGWMRLYIIAVTLWAGLLSYWLYAALPSRPDDSSLEFMATSQLSRELTQIRGIVNPIDRYRSADGFCEGFYVKATDQSNPINKNQCLEFLVNPDKRDPTSDAITEIWLKIPFRKDMVRDLREAHDTQFRSTLEDLLPNFVVRLIGGPVVLLTCGLLVAWVRRGFMVNTRQ